MPARALALALGLVLGVLVLAPAAHADPKICFYVEDRDVFRGSATGHAFTQLLPDTGPDATNRELVYGFHPKYPALFLTGGPGQVWSESDHGWTWKVCHTVGAPAYAAAARQIAADTTRPPRYVFLTFNCTDWAYKIAQSAGVSLPSARIFGGIFDPAEVAAKLRAIYARGERTVNGGRIYPNPKPGVLPRDSFESQSLLGRPGERPSTELEGTESAREMLDLAFHDHRRAARGLDMSAHRITGDPVRVGVGRRLRISLRGTDPDGALTEVRFGDGARAFHGTRFSHAYRRTGRYRVRVAAISNAAVHRFDFVVRAVRAGDAESVRTRVPRGRARRDGLPARTAPVLPRP